MRFFLVCLLLFPFLVNATIRITLPKPSHEATPVNRYLIQLITESLHAVGKRVDIQYSAERMNQKRAMLSLAQGNYINLSWFTKTPEREARLTSIRFPLYKGLHGVRLLIINKKAKDQFAKVSSLIELGQFVGLQKSSWSDYDVLVANGLTIEGDLPYQSMYKAIDTGIADYFPRSAMTVLSELKNNRLSNLMLEPNLSLHYDNVFYFYLNNNDNQLNQLLSEGLNRLKKSGRFDEIFHRYFSNRVAGLDLENRTKLYLTLPADFPMVNEK